MRLLCIYQHAPTPGAPGIYRHRTLLAELVRRGWQVDLVSSPINYMLGTAPAGYRGTLHRRETIDGIDHHWVWASQDVHASLRRRALNYVSFASTATLVGSRLPRPDVIWASSPPLSVGSVGQALARRFRRPWVFEVRDLWPESAAAAGLLPAHSRTYRTVDRFARGYARRAAAVIVPTPGLVDPVRGHGARDVTVITGAMPELANDPAERARWRNRLGAADQDCLFVYAGAHGIVNGLDTLLDAAALVATETNAPTSRVLVAMAGDGSASADLRARVEREAIPGVTMLGPLGKAEVAGLLAAADVCLHMLRPDPMFETALPTKVLEYLGASRPFITTVPGLPRDIALASGGAYAAGAEALAAELRRWAALDGEERFRRGMRAHETGVERFGLQATVDRLEELLVRVARPTARHSASDTHSNS